MKTDIFNELEKNNKIANVGFSHIHQLFIEYDWNLSKNTYNEIIYSKKYLTQDEFIIKVNDKTIDIYVPLKNKNVLYRTSFYGYFDASEYLELHLNSYEDNNLIN